MSWPARRVVFGRILAAEQHDGRVQPLRRAEAKSDCVTVNSSSFGLNMPCSRPLSEPMFEKCSVFRFDSVRIAIHIVDHFNFAYFAFWQNRRGGGVLGSFGE